MRLGRMNHYGRVVMMMDARRRRMMNDGAGVMTGNHDAPRAEDNQDRCLY
jgi:hypothetical protein